MAHTIDLNDFFKKLGYGELANLASAVDSTGTIKKEKQDQIIFHINVCLLELALKYPLREGSETVTLVKDQSTVWSHEDLLQVTSIISPYGESLPFTKVRSPHHIWISGTEVHIPASVSENTKELQINFRMRVDSIDPVREPEDLHQILPIPAEMIEVLSSYVAWKMYLGMNSQDTLQMAEYYRTRYEQVQAELVHFGMFGDNILPYGKLERRGFV